jgi:tetratricopeptide (TPR) repeat protein
MMEEYEYLVHPLRVARVERGFTQEELAQETGLGVSTIRRAEQWFPLNIKSQRMLSNYFKKTPKELGLIGRGWTQGSAQPIAASQTAPNPSQHLPAVAAPMPLLRKAAPTAHYTPTQALDLLGAQPNIVTDQHAGAWLALGTSHLAQLFNEGWSLENILESLCVVLQSTQDMPTIARRKLLQLSGNALTNGISVPANEHVSGDDKVRFNQSLGKSIGDAWKLFHTVGNAQVHAIGQTLLSLLRQNQMILSTGLRPQFYSAVYNLIGITLHFQECNHEALQAHHSAYIGALASGNSWCVIQSLICLATSHQALGQHTDAIQTFEEALRILGNPTDEAGIRSKAHVLACWADNGLTIGDFTTAQDKLKASEAYLDLITPDEEFDRASHHQLTGKYALTKHNYQLAVDHLESAIAEMPSQWSLRRTITLVPLAVAYARAGEKEQSLRVAKQALPVVRLLNAPMINYMFKGYIQKDLRRLFVNDTQVLTFITEAQHLLPALASKQIAID